MRYFLIRHAFTLVACSLLFGFVLLLAPTAQAQGQSTSAELNSFTVAEIAQMREKLAQEPPAGLNDDQLTAYFTQQEAIATRLGDIVLREQVLRKWVASVKNNYSPRWTLGSTLIQTEKRAEGFALMEEVVQHSKYPNEKVGSRSQLAMSYLDDGNYKRASALLKEAEEFVKFELDRMSVSGQGAYWKQHSLTRFYNAKCMYEAASMKFAQAQQFCLLSIQAAEKLVSYDNLVSLREQQYGQAWLSGTILRMAGIERMMGHIYESERYTRQALEVAKKYNAKRENFAGIYYSMADIRFLQGQYDDSIAYVDRVIDIHKQNKINSASSLMIWAHHRLQNTYVAQGQWAKALANFDEIDKITNGNERAKRLALNLHPRAVAYVQSGRGAQIEKQMKASVDYNAERHDPDHFHTGFARGIYGLTLASQNDSEKNKLALQELTRAISSITSNQGLGDGFEDLGIRKMFRKLIFERYLSLIGEQPSVDIANQAFMVADVIRSSSVQQAMNEAAVRSAAQTSGLGDLVRRDQDAKQEMVALLAFLSKQSGESQEKRLEAVRTQMQARIAEIEKDRTKLRIDIAKQFPEYEKLINPKPPSIADVANGLATGEVFISLMPTTDYVYVWAVSKTGSFFHRASLSQLDVQKLVSRLRKTLDVAGATNLPKFDESASAELYAKLLKPIDGVMAGASHVVFAPAGELGQFPFGVLLTNASTGNIPNNSWLIKQAAISHVASASAWGSLKLLAKAKSAPESLMAWADPAFDGKMSATAASTTRQVAFTRSTNTDIEKEAPKASVLYSQIPPLPETRDEVIAIAKSLSADASKDIIYGTAATRESVLAVSKSGLLGRKRVVTFATHGLIAGDLPNLTQPALAMAANGKEGNDPLAPLLTLEDVLTLKLNADWVVLSACNTAAADGKAEEALSGLARGFFYAGSKSLLVTHWAVESNSAMALTTATFEHYTKNPTAPKAESLRQAMLQVQSIKGYEHPAFWAPYALVGDGSR
jgi:CHAT domain-containing protein